MNTAAITRKHSRRAHDFYPTPAWATQELLKRVPISGTLLECCAGDGAIALVLKADGNCVYESDLVNKQPGGATVVSRDATKSEFWTKWTNSIDFVVTNPPFSLASSILPLAYDHARVGVAFLLRLSYLEPCRDRADWLVQHPLTKLPTLPRISFTGDHKTDSVTCAWFVWIKGESRQQVEVVSKAIAQV